MTIRAGICHALATITLSCCTGTARARPELVPGNVPFATAWSGDLPTNVEASAADTGWGRHVSRLEYLPSLREAEAGGRCVESTTVHFVNRAHGIRARLGARGINVESRVGPTWSVRMETLGLSRGGDLLAAPIQDVGLDGERAVVTRSWGSEWHANDATGIEQGFDVAERLPGTGPLRIVQAVSGAAVSQPGRDGVLFEVAGKRVLAYRKLVATDASGRPLGAWMETTEGRLVLAIDDEQARYPLHVDPLLTSAEWSGESDESIAWFGHSVASGDVNGDGYGDVLVAAPQFDAGTTNEGAVFAWYGSASGLGANGVPSNAHWMAHSNQTGSYFGRSTSLAGDFNGDGYDDVVVSASQYDGAAGSGAGAVWIWYGSAAGVNGGVEGEPANADWALYGAANQSAGHSLEAGGDVNGDGFDDLLIGVPGYDPFPGARWSVLLWHGSPSGPNGGPVAAPGSHDWAAGGDAGSDSFGWGVGFAGSVDGDAYDDVIIGDPLYTNGPNPEDVREGAAFVWNGSSTGVNGGVVGVPTNAAWRAESNQFNTFFGHSVAGVGDVNCDGFADVLVGAMRYASPETSEGATFAWHGSPLGLNGGVAGTPANAAWSAQSDVIEAHFGNCVAPAGDVNSDGYSDVLVTAYLYSNPELSEGAAFVWHGSALGINEGSPGTPSNADWAFEADQVGAWIGGDGIRAAMTAGDVDGDGYDDVIVGALSHDSPELSEGRAWLFRGSVDGLAWEDESNQIKATLGTSVASAGDVDDDGIDDVIVGAPHFDNGLVDQGRAFLYLGALGGPPTGPAWTADGEFDHSHFGTSVASAGDVNGDFRDDVIVGAPRRDPIGGVFATEDRAYVFHGQPGGLASLPDWEYASPHPLGQFGTSVSSAGDVNDDGYADVIVGEPLHHPLSRARTGGGRVLVFHGSASGLPLAETWFAWNPTAGLFGWSVASAGDVNADGASDVIVGAPYYESSEETEGHAFAWLGSLGGLGPTGTPANADWLAQADHGKAYLGWSVAGAGDVDGDTTADVIIGAPGYDGTFLDTGLALVWHGAPGIDLGADGTPANADWLASGDGSGTAFGTSVAGGGDYNGDYYGDAVVGAPNLATSGQGRMHVYCGGGTGLGPSPAWRAIGTSGDLLGHSVAFAGDVDGDGLDDLLVGSPAYSNGEASEGRAQLYLGRRDCNCGLK